MKIIIETEGNSVMLGVENLEESEKGTLPDVIAPLMGGVEAMCFAVLEDAEEAEIQELHDYMTGVFSLFMEKVFPGRAEFGLSDAALIKAQDDIIKQAIADGKSIEDAVADYNKKADEYYAEVKAHAGKMS